MIVLIGNKCWTEKILLAYLIEIGDLNADRKVSFEEGKNFAAQNNLIFIETSAKDGVGVDEECFFVSPLIKLGIHDGKQAHLRKI